MSQIHKDIFLTILSFADSITVAICCRICKQWFEWGSSEVSTSILVFSLILTNNKSIWNNLLQRDCPTSLIYSKLSGRNFASKRLEYAYYKLIELNLTKGYVNNYRNTNKLSKDDIFVE